MSTNCKYYKQKKQWKYTDSSTWADVVPAEYQKGALYEEESVDCGFVPTHFKLFATYSNSSSYIVDCNSSTTLNATEVSGHSTPCSSMTTAEIGDCVTIIGYGAFRHCTSLTSCTIGSGVTTIADEAFIDAYSLSSIYIPDNVINLYRAAFRECSGLTNCIIGNGVTAIGGGAFANCTSLTSCTIGSGVTSIESYAFYSAATMTNVTFPNVSTIGEYAFYSCGGLTNIDLPNVTTIGKSSFEGCFNMTGLTIGSRVTSIGDNAFFYCTNASSIICLATTPPTLGSYPFGRFVEEYYHYTIYVPAASVNAYKSAWSHYASWIQAIP